MIKNEHSYDRKAAMENAEVQRFPRNAKYVGAKPDIDWMYSKLDRKKITIKKGIKKGHFSTKFLTEGGKKNNAFYKILHSMMYYLTL